MATGDPAPG